MKSIIIPIYNQHEFSQIAIQSVLENTTDFELIIIDNGSDPPFKPLFSGFIETRLIRNDENLGFPVAVNQGIKAAKGDVIVLLNNDVVCSPGWSEKLLPGLNEFSIVGPVTNYAAGIQGVEPELYSSTEGLYDAAAKWSEMYGDAIQEVNYVIGFCMAFRKSLAEELGWWDDDEYKYFDDSLWPCSGEELDFCLKARAGGHKIGIVMGCYVHHEGSQTFKDMERAGQLDYEEVCKRNDIHLFEKWGEDWYKQKIVPDFVGGIRLNLGCGSFHLDGFTNVDQFVHVQPDLLCDVTDLPYEPGTVDEIYAGHLLEHFHFKDGKKALAYWFSMLKSGGRIGICVPNYDFLVKKYVENPTPEALVDFNNTYIYSGIQPSPHLFAYSAALLEKVMVDAGFIQVERMPIAHPYFVDPVEWQCGFMGVKP